MIETPEGKEKGLLPRVSALGELYPCAAIDKIPPLPSAQWQSMNHVRWLERWTWDLDQNGYSACTCYGLAHAIMFTLARMDSEAALPELDCIPFYHRFTKRGGVALDAAMSEAMTNGYPTKGGGRVLVTEAYDAAKLEDLAAAYQRGYFAIFGHDVHCECGLTMSLAANSWMVDTRNSWGREWSGGVNGFHTVPLGDIEIERYGVGIVCDVRVET